MPHQKLYFSGAVLRVAKGRGRQAWILSTLRGFWAAIIENHIETTRAVMAKVTAHWMTDLLPRFETEPKQS